MRERSAWLLGALFGWCVRRFHGSAGCVGVLLEPLGVHLGEVRPFGGDVVGREDGIDGTCREASVAVNALFRVDVELLLTFVDAVDRTLVDTCTVFDSDTWLSDDVSHQTLLIGRTAFKD
jgi:hypothetical protein